ncbi:MAG: fluoride efflux transporter CrcB [Pseudomonadota bacterium]
MIHWTLLAAVAGGGAIGSAGRYLINTVWLPAAGPHAMPWGTWLVNVSGSFLYGLLFAVLTQYLPQDSAGGATLRVALLAGFLGGFTTFSSFSFETVRLIQEGQLPLALAYVLGSVLSCVLAVWLGLQLVKPPVA